MPTHIEWADETWNPTVGCTRVSPGCDHCYAFALHDQRYAAKRRGATLPAQYDRPFSQVQLLADRLAVPLRRRKPTRYFVDSMADLFHQDVPNEYLDRVFASMALAPQHQFLVLTKRPDRMRAYLAKAEGGPWSPPDAEERINRVTFNQSAGHMPWPVPNVWLGVSVEDQQRAMERIPLLLDTPAAVRFVSAEPLLGPIDLRTVPIPVRGPRELAVHRLDWLIIGGESGKHARPMDLAWARGIVAQCRAASASVFVKQLGAHPHERIRGRMTCRASQHIWAGSGCRMDWHRSALLRDPKGGDPAEWPEDLRVREWPAEVRPALAEGEEAGDG